MRMAKIAFFLILIAFVGYGVLAYLALSVYPEKIRQEQSRMPAVRAALQELTGDQLMLSKKIQEMADSVSKNGLSKVQATSRLLADGDVNRLALNYLGNDFLHACETLEKQRSENERFERELQRKMLELNGRKKALSNDFVGRIGKGSREWNRKWEEVENQFQLLSNKKQDLSKTEKALQTLAVRSEKDTLERLRQTLAARVAALKEREEYLHELQRRKDLISIWPISRIGEFFGR